MLVHPLRGLGGGEEGVGLIGQGKDHVQLPRPHAPEFFQHGQAVDQVAEVDDQGEEGRLRQGRPRRQQGHPQVLPGAGVDNRAHQHRPAHAAADGLEHQPEGHADGQIAHQHRDGHRKGGGQGRSIHVECTSSEKI